MKNDGNYLGDDREPEEELKNSWKAE